MSRCLRNRNPRQGPMRGASQLFDLRVKRDMPGPIILGKSPSAMQIIGKKGLWRSAHIHMHVLMIVLELRVQYIDL
jgi:hypothetical protein